MKKKIIFIVSLLLALSIPSVAYAEEYGNTYPAYVPVSGGAYIEVQCALGRGTLVFAREYKDGYLAFTAVGIALLIYRVVPSVVPTIRQLVQNIMQG